MNRDEYNVTERYKERMAAMPHPAGDITASPAFFKNGIVSVVGAGALLLIGYRAYRLLRDNPRVLKRTNRQLKRRARRILLKGVA